MQNWKVIIPLPLPLVEDGGLRIRCRCLSVRPSIVKSNISHKATPESYPHTGRGSTCGVKPCDKVEISADTRGSQSEIKVALTWDAVLYAMKLWTGPQKHRKQMPLRLFFSVLAPF
jgi:hypothetical protein